MELKKFEGQNKNELSMVEVAHALLEETGDVYDFTKLLVVIQEYLELSEEVLESRMSRFYTDINIDGRFISLGENRWGLRAWYPIDSIDEEIVGTIDDEDLPRRRRRKKTNKINAFGDGEDIIDYNEDDPEDIDDIYDEDYDLEDEEDDDEEEELEGLTEIEIEDDEVTELKDYEEDLSEFSDDDIDLDSEIEVDDEDYDLEDEEDSDLEEDLEEDIEDEEE